MLTIDWIVLAVLAASAVLGMLFGFGKLLKFFTGGIVGFIISIFVVYFFTGIVSGWGFVKELMERLHTVMEEADNGFVDFLMDIGIEKIILYAAIFIVAQIIRIIIVNIIKGIVEIDNPLMKAINKFFGLVFMLAAVCALTLIVFQIVHAIGGETAENFRQNITGTFRLEWVYDNNPLNALFEKLGEAAQNFGGVLIPSLA